MELFYYLWQINRKRVIVMANKRLLKKAITRVSEDLFVECVAASVYGNDVHKDNNAEAVLSSIIKMHSNFTRRISHPEPGMPAKAYFKDLREKFSSQASELIDQINNL